MEFASEKERHHQFLQLALDEACKSVENGNPPFGAVIVDSTNQIVAAVHAEVYTTNDPTAHAEVTAIRHACEKLQRCQLSDCVLYTSCYPCPMCLCACLWAKIPQVFALLAVCVPFQIYYSATAELAAEYNFADKQYHDYCRKRDNELCSVQHMEMDTVRTPFESWEKKPDKELTEGFYYI